MFSSRVLTAGDFLALLAFALLGLASHENEVTASALARTFLPFAAAWLLVGGLTGIFGATAGGKPQSGLRFLGVYLLAGVCALVVRSIIFDRTLFNAFFVIGLVGNGLFLFTWRCAYNWWLTRRSAPARIEDATRT